MRRFLQLLFILMFFTAIVGKDVKKKKKKAAEENEDVFSEEPVSTKHWIDPDNMAYDSPIHPKPTSSVTNHEDNLVSAFQNIQDQLSKCKQELQSYPGQSPPKQTPICSSPHLKQIVQALLKSTSDTNPYTEIKLTPENRDVLRNFLDDQANIHDAVDIVKNSIAEKTFKETFQENYWIYIKEKFDIVNLFVIVFLLFVVSSVVLFEMRTRLTIRQQFSFLLIIAFLVSIPWEWFRLYKKEFAKKQSVMMKNIAKHCHTDHELSFTQSLSLWGKSLFSVEDSTCNKYQEALLIDPALEVPPFMAVSVTITRFIVEPFELFADATGKSFRALFQHLPIQWQPFMFLACMVIIILCLILFSGIRISTPFLQIGLGVDPAITNASLQRLEQQVRELNAAAIQNGNPPAIQNVADGNNRDQLNAVLNHLQAINERSQGHDNDLQEIKDSLDRLRPVAEQARQAEAIEHPEPWELVGNRENNPDVRVSQFRRPVQASEHHPTESNSPI